MCLTSFKNVCKDLHRRNQELVNNFLAWGAEECWESIRCLKQQSCLTLEIFLVILLLGFFGVMQLFLLLGSGAGKHTGLPQQHNPLTSRNIPSATDSIWETHESLNHEIEVTGS